MDNIIIVLTMLLLGVAFLSYKFLVARKILANARYLNTSTIGDVEQSLYEMAKIEGEGYKHYCEVKGPLKVTKQNKLPFSKHDVAFFKFTITEVYEVKERVKQKDGSYEWETKERKRTAYEEYSTGTLFISDETSDNKVYFHKSIPKECNNKIRNMIGSAADSFILSKGIRPTATGGSSGEFQRWELCEEFMYEDSQIYSLGCAYWQKLKPEEDSQKVLFISNPEKKVGVGILTDSSEEELIAKKIKQVKLYAIGAIACLVAFIGILIAVVNQ